MFIFISGKTNVINQLLSIMEKETQKLESEKSVNGCKSRYRITIYKQDVSIFLHKIKLHSTQNGLKVYWFSMPNNEPHTKSTQ